jgi:polyisoprenoid-binding protein YceI
MTAALALPVSAPIMNWHVVPTKSRIRFSAGRFLGTSHGTLHNVSGVVRLIEGQPRYTHVDIRVPVATFEKSARRRLGLDGDLYQFVSFHGWRIRGNPRRSFALDGELHVGEIRRQVVADVVASGSHFDEATETEEATFNARLSLGRRLRVVLDITLARPLG